jgi:DNA-binding transcriptional LysR family regulator
LHGWSGFGFSGAPIHRAWKFVFHGRRIDLRLANPLIDKPWPAIEFPNSLRATPAMNIHHLELFYYVARHGGVSAAARRIPYGIQQPAISAQIIQLENDLGTALFVRRPFQLTKAGEELLRFVEPFFGGIDETGRRLRGGGMAGIRIGAMEIVQREYLPQILKALQRRFAGMRFTLVPADIYQIESALLAQEIDIGVGRLLGKRPEGIRQREMIRVPMALMVPARSPLKSPDDLWKKDRIDQPLITASHDPEFQRLFQAELRRREVEWFPSIEFISQELVARYVVEGFGIGLVLVEPGVATPKGTRLLPLDGFPSIPYGVLWTGVQSPLQRAFLDEAQALAGSLHDKAPSKPRTSWQGGGRP